MTMRLIDTEEAFEMADEFPAFEEGLADKTDLKDLLKICDTIEARPVVHAHWKRYPDCGVTRCSNCGWSIEECWNSKLCPDCGAQMDGTDTNVGSKGVKIPVISTEDVPKIMEEMEK